MTGGVTDGNEDGFVLFFGPLESVLTPGVPVHRIVGVLEEVRTLFVDQPVGVLERTFGLRTHPPPSPG
jgi:hypothetical protein